MKISGDNTYMNVDVYTRNVDEKLNVDGVSKQDGHQEKGILKTDKVVLSAAARTFRKAREIADDIPEIRKQKVEELKSRIRSGTYPIDPKKVAQGMLRESLLNDVL